LRPQHSKENTQNGEHNHVRYRTYWRVGLLGTTPPFGKPPPDSVVFCGQLVVVVAEAFAA